MFCFRTYCVISLPLRKAAPVTQPLYPDRLFQMACDYVHPNTSYESAKVIHPFFRENHLTLVRHYTELQNVMAVETGLMLQPLAHDRNDPNDLFTFIKNPAETLFAARQDMLTDMVLAAPGHHRFAVTAQRVKEDRHEWELLSGVQQNATSSWKLQTACVNYFMWGDLTDEYQPHVRQAILKKSDHFVSHRKDAKILPEFLKIHSLRGQFISEAYRIMDKEKNGPDSLDKERRENISPAFVEAYHALCKKIQEEQNPPSPDAQNPDQPKGPDTPGPTRFPFNFFLN